MATDTKKIEFEASGIPDRYNQLKTLRDPYLTRFEQYAEWTLPYMNIGVDETSGETGGNDSEQPWTSIGARCVNHLANKYMLNSFPAARPFFRYDVPERTMLEIMNATGDTKTNIEFAFGRLEREAAIKQFERRKSRMALLEAYKHLIVCGNALVYIPKEGNIQCYSLADYVVLRDPSGEAIEIITKDRKDISTLKPELRALLAQESGREENDKQPIIENVDIYTRIRFKEGRYLVQQSLDKYAIEGESYVDKEHLRWLPLRWNSIRKEHYGRGLVEDNRGNFHAATMITQALAEGVIAASDLKYLVDPNSGVDVEELTKSATGTYHYGERDSLFLIDTTNSSVWQFLMSRLEHYERELGMTFLLNTSATRQAERVTAQEIRLQAQELETSHGGVYSTLAMELQRPLAIFLLEDVESQIGGQDIEPVIVTGLEALGRAADLESLQLWLQDLTLWKDIPEEFKAELSPRDYMTFSATGRGVEYPKFMKPIEEQQEDEANMQRQQMSASMMQAGLDGMSASAGKTPLPELAKAATGMADGMGIKPQG